MSEPQAIEVDPYVLDVLMRDLVGHDRAPSAFLIYLWLWRRTRGCGRSRLSASLQMLATETGLSKSAVQGAIERLKRRRLISAERSAATAPPIYTVHQPWQHQSMRSGRSLTDGSGEP